MRLKHKIIEHVKNNYREYILVSIIFVIGIFLGVMFTNNSKEEQTIEITQYFSGFIENLKNTEDIETMSMLKTSMINNLLLALELWFFGTTVIRNTSSIWNCAIQRFLLRIYNINNNYSNGIKKRLNLCIDNFIIAKYNIYSGNVGNSSKSDLNFINQF